LSGESRGTPSTNSGYNIRWGLYLLGKTQKGFAVAI